MAKWKQMKMIVGSIMVGALLMPTMSITAWADAETEVTVDNFESEILPNLAIKEDGTPLKVAITVAELDSEYVIAVQKYAQYLLETAGAEVTVSSADGDVENQCNQIYDFIEKGVDVVLIQAADSNAVAPAVKACNEAGVTAIAVGRAINGDCTVDYSAITGEDEGFPCHHALLETNSEQKERTLLLFEDVNIQKLLGVERIKEICAFPIRFSQLEAAPVAMVAITDHI